MSRKDWDDDRVGYSKKEKFANRKKDKRYKNGKR